MTERNDDEDELTTVHAGEPPRANTSTVRVGPPTSPRPEGTVRLDAAGVQPGPREETVLLSADAAGDEARPPRPSDAADWGTVVLPGGGHPDQDDDRTPMMPLGEPGAASGPAATPTPGAPQPFAAVDSTRLTGIHFPQPEPVRSPLGAWAIPRVGLTRLPTEGADVRTRGGGAAAMPEARGTAGGRGGTPDVHLPADDASAPPEAHASSLSTAPTTPIDRRALEAAVKPEIYAPAGGTAVHGVPAAGGTVVVHDARASAGGTAVTHDARASAGGTVVVHDAAAAGRTTVVPVAGPPAAVPVAAPTSTGTQPSILPSGGYPVTSGPQPIHGPAPTGSSPILARTRGRPPAPDGTARLAWGFLLGVLLTVAILGLAVALALYFMR